jgi:hypothetical protein
MRSMNVPVQIATSGNHLRMSPLCNDPTTEPPPGWRP